MKLFWNIFQPGDKEVCTMFFLESAPSRSFCAVQYYSQNRAGPDDGHALGTDTALMVCLRTVLQQAASQCSSVDRRLCVGAASRGILLQVVVVCGVGRWAPAQRGNLTQISLQTSPTTNASVVLQRKESARPRFEIYAFLPSFASR